MLHPNPSPYTLKTPATPLSPQVELYLEGGWGANSSFFCKDVLQAPDKLSVSLTAVQLHDYEAYITSSAESEPFNGKVGGEGRGWGWESERGREAGKGERAEQRREEGHQGLREAGSSGVPKAAG